MIVQGILLAIVALVIFVLGFVIVDIRVILLGFVSLVVGLFGIYWFLKKT